MFDRQQRLFPAPTTQRVGASCGRQEALRSYDGAWNRVAFPTECTFRGDYLKFLNGGLQSLSIMDFFSMESDDTIRYGTELAIETLLMALLLSNKDNSLS